MKFFLSTKIPETQFKIGFGQPVVMLGSCFSDEMSNHFLNGGLEVLTNPFGTIFHPVPIANSLLNTLAESQNVNILKRENCYYTWECSTKVSASSKEKITDKLISTREKLRYTLSKAQCLIVTFGTSWGYRHKEFDELVANCHKVGSDTFEKQLTSTSEIVNVWKKVIERLLKFCPNLKLIFTVSPVRHKRDGLIENNRSKAQLIEAVHQLVDVHEHCYYFPSYEIVLDELRDYRFFKQDLVHPNDQAIFYVWKRFTDVYFSEKTISIAEEVAKVNKGLEHRTSDERSEQNKRHLRLMNDRRNELSKRIPEIYWK